MTTMPASTQRAHFKPSWRGDRYRAIVVTGKKPLGRDRVRALDMNFQWVWNDPTDRTKGGKARAMHWTKPFLNNYRFMLDHGARRNRPMTRAERRRPIDEWHDADVARWRRTRNPHSAHPPTYAECVNFAQRHHVVITAELKSPAFALDVAGKYLVAAATHAGHPPWFMALINMRGCRGKCASVIRNGGEFAIIFGRFRRLARNPPPDWDRWDPKPTRLWGPAKWSLK